MASWFAANWGTLLVSLALVGVVALIIRNMKNDKKQGKSTCGGSCAHCAMGGSCHRK